MRHTWPITYHVELTGPSQGCQWEGDVTAYSKDVALVMAGKQAALEDILIVDSTHVTITRKEG